MNIGSSASDIGLMVLLLFPALLAPAILIGIGLLIGRILRLPALFAVAFAIGSVGVLLIAGSVALDRSGQALPGLVERRTETVDLRPQGDWRHALSVSVRYRLDGGVPVDDQPSFDESATTFQLTPAQFDRVPERGPTMLRVLPLFRSIALVRLADLTTLDLFPWLWIGSVPLVLLLFWLGGRLMSSRVGAVLLVGLVAAGAIGIPTALSYRQWQASEELSSRPLRATAQVREVTRITQVDPFPCTPGSGSRCSRRDTMFDVAQPYDIVQFDFVPEGAGGPVIGVDAIDALATSESSMAAGTTISIAYAPGEPRDAQILETTHTHYWRNALGFVVMVGGGVLLVVALLWWAVQRNQRTRRQRKAGQAQRPVDPVSGG